MGPGVSVAPANGSAEESADGLVAADITGMVWAAIIAAGGTGRPAVAGHVHYRGVYNKARAALLALPIDEHTAPAGSVALLADTHDAHGEFERPAGRQQLAEAYAARPRTRVYEDIGRDAPHAWYTRVAQHLGRLAGCELAVVCTVFQSAAGDESLGAHTDAWYGAIMQISGAKSWEIGFSLLDGSDRPTQQVTTTAGDLLLLPKGLAHRAWTPPDPGHSVHLAFAIDRDDQLSPATRPPGIDSMATTAAGGA
jgi:hypothetical protein